MFKKFTKKDNLASTTQVKGSVQKQIRAKVLEQMPLLTPYIEDLLPKKSPIFLAKCHDHVNIIICENVPLFIYNSQIKAEDELYFPTLRVLHKYPFVLPHFQVDRGAVKFILSGADIMCPGLTSEGGKVDMNVKKHQMVAIMVEGKEHSIAIGKTLMTPKEIVEINKDIGVKNEHYLNDGLWTVQAWDELK